MQSNELANEHLDVYDDAGPCLGDDGAPSISIYQLDVMSEGSVRLVMTRWDCEARRMSGVDCWSGTG